LFALVKQEGLTNMRVSLAEANKSLSCTPKLGTTLRGRNGKSYAEPGVKTNNTDADFEGPFGLLLLPIRI